MLKAKNYATRQAYIEFIGTIDSKFESFALLRPVDVSINNPCFPVLGYADIISGSMFKCQ